MTTTIPVVEVESKMDTEKDVVDVDEEAPEITVLPGNLQIERDAFLDHKYALGGFGDQTVHTGTSAEVRIHPHTDTSHEYTSFQCRARVRGGKGRRCRSMCRRTFPFCRQHTRYTLGVANRPFNALVPTGRIKQGLIAYKAFKKDEYIATAGSIAVGKSKAFKDFNIFADGAQKDLSVPNQSTIGRYAEHCPEPGSGAETHKGCVANAEYVPVNVIDYNPQTKKDETTQIILIKSTKAIKKGSEVFIDFE